jgi:tetratricopeptide (TPR) repeat protein
VEEMTREILLLIVLIPSILIICLSVSGEVSVKEIEMNIPTYATGPDDPSPPLWNLRVYPYPMQTDITRKKIIKKYRVVVMENDYIQLLILPELGGRILAAIDKTNDNFDFIYHNQVMKPGLVALREDPISPLVLLEKELLSRESELDILRADPEYYLEAAADYSEMNLTDDAIRVLEIYGENTNTRDYPILYYYLGFFNDELKRREEAAAYFKKAATCNPDYVFPFRIETESVLKVALEYNPSDWKAHYYLGNLFVANLRWEEGLEHFKNAAAFTPEFPVIYRNLGEIYWKKFKDYERAREMYEKAVSFAPYDYRLYLALDELYALTRKHSARAKLYREAPRTVKKNFNYVLKRAQYYVDTGQYAKAFKILKSNTFLPWEGWTGAREVFVLAHLGRAYSYMTNGKYKKAINDFFEAMQYPENLGTGRPLHPLFTREYYFIGLCYEKLGNKQRAEKYISKVKVETTGVPTVHSYYKALSLRKLGEGNEAERLLNEMKLKSESLIEHSRRMKPQYYLWASMACDALGEKIRAREYLRKAAEIDPSYRWAALFASEIKLLE